jgi:hypothetical protein
VPSDTLAVLDAIPTEQVPAAITRLSARLLTPVNAADDLLSAEQAAKLLKASRRWLYAHADELGGVRMSRKKILFPRRTVLARIARKGRRS